jgi:hypothetical protein
LKPDFYWSRFNRAKALIALGRKEDAIKDYEYLLERDPSNQGIRNLLNGLRAEIATLPVPTAETPSPVLRSLPPAVQKEIEQVRESCPLDEKNTSGDEGLQTFTVSGAQAVLVDTLNFCGEGRRCLHSVNCATGYTHSVAIYVRYGNVWRKSFSVDATEPIFLSVEPYAENPKFRALVLSVHAGWDLGCPVRNKNDGTAWKREKCDFVVKWDGTKFTYKPL